MIVMFRWYSLFAVAIISGGVAASCSTSDTSSGVDDEGGDSTGIGGSGGQGGDFIGNTGGYQNQGGGDICEATEAEALQKTLDMIVVLDRSGSMGGTKWTGSVNALTQFFNDPTSQGVWAGINFFPPVGAGDECDASTYNPLQVDLGELQAYAPTLISAMGSTAPSGGTPTYGAMHGSLQVATGHQDANPDHVVIVVLASDGDPTSCDIDIDNISDLSLSAYNYNGVMTFAVAIQGASVANLNLIAQKGGSGQAFDVTSDISLFKQKMEEIRAQALGCEYLIPEPDGDEFDPLALNVEYTAGGTTTPQDLPQADNAADCGGGPGWYYDNPTDPTKVILCPASCGQIEVDTGAKINLLFGCPTILN